MNFNAIFLAFSKTIFINEVSFESLVLQILVGRPSILYPEEIKKESLGKPYVSRFKFITFSHIDKRMITVSWDTTYYRVLYSRIRKTSGFHV